MEVENCASTIETQSLTRINGRYYPFPYGTPNAILSVFPYGSSAAQSTEKA